MVGVEQKIAREIHDLRLSIMILKDYERPVFSGAHEIRIEIAELEDKLRNICPHLTAHRQHTTCVLCNKIIL